MKKTAFKSVTTCLMAGSVMPVYALNLADTEQEVLPTMVIEGEILTPAIVGIKPDMGGVNDAAALLKRVPGANVNSNGPLSGIAQYRGLFGDRVNVNSDGATYKSACANAMDAPLSHVPTSLTETMSIKRGIASVSRGIETLGGNIVQRTRRGEFSENDDIKFSGKTTNGVNSVNNAYYTSIFSNVANSNHKFRLGGSREEGGNYDWDGGENIDTSHERNAATLGYGYRTDDQNETSNYNDEVETPGYFIWNLRGQYRPQYHAVKGLQVGFGIENLLDESYRTHLSGLNRNAANDNTAVGEHLPGPGRNFYATLSYDW